MSDYNSSKSSPISLYTAEAQPLRLQKASLINDADSSAVGQVSGRSSTQRAHPATLSRFSTWPSKLKCYLQALRSQPEEVEDHTNHPHHKNFAKSRLANTINSTNSYQRSKTSTMTNYASTFQTSKAPMMAANDMGLRLMWQYQEIVRINTEKELAIKESQDFRAERDQMQQELDELRDLRQEIGKLEQLNADLREIARTSTCFTGDAGVLVPGVETHDV